MQLVTYIYYKYIFELGNPLTLSLHSTICS